MYGFLQGFAYGLFLSCLPWFFMGLVNPRRALPTEPPQRRQVFVRYWFAFPFLAFLLWLTSLWGGFSPSLEGWLAGLVAIAVEVPLERRWRRWRANRQERRRLARLEAEATERRMALEQEQREAGMYVLNPEQPPVDADQVVLALCAGKQRLVTARRPAHAVQADRLYTRYQRALEVLRAKFDPREVTFERWHGVVAEVCRGAIDNLNSMASFAEGVAGIDVDYVRRRLLQEANREGNRMPEQERHALSQRMQLVDDTEQRLRELMARNETVLTALDDAAVAMARVETERPQAAQAAEIALSDLRRLIDKAELYGHRKGAL